MNLFDKGLLQRQGILSLFLYTKTRVLSSKILDKAARVTSNDTDKHKPIRRTPMAVIDTIMKTHVITASPDDNIGAVAKTMKEKGLGAVIVTENDKITGILSERDILNKVVAEDKDPHGISVKEVFTPNPVTVKTGTHIKDCAEIIRTKKFRHLPVIQEDGKPAGIISSRDFLGYVVSNLEKFIDKANYQKDLGDGEDPYDHMGGGYEHN